MELADLKHFNTLDMLKYLAYLQVCQENSSHLQILQELQNRVLVESLVKYQKLTFRNLCTVVIFLHLSDRVASRLGFGYYEIGDYTSSDEIKLLDIDDKKQECLEFTKEEMEAILDTKEE